MIRHVMLLALGAITLGGCWGETAPPPLPKPSPRPTFVDPRVDWIVADPECRGWLRRGEWLVCDNNNLRYLHRMLASEWATRRQGADRRVLRVMQRQQAALLSERSLCEDAACVATAYRRYLSGYSQPRPAWTPKPRKPIKKPPPRHHHRDDWGSGGSGSSCAAEVGGSASAYLVRQCRVVNGGGARGCTAQRSCDDLREMINDGCSNGESRPGFCKRR